jgi:ParB family chromosome partitioning protein
MALATIQIDSIDVGQRLRNVSEAQVETLVASITDVGLLNPITVYQCEVFRNGSYVPGYGVVAGAHRLEACKRLGLVEIEANVVTLDDLDRQIAECDENLCATTLTKAERALFTKRRKDAYEAKYPETKAYVAGAHGSNKVQGNASAKLAPAFTADTAAKTGQSERVVQRDAERGTKISENALSLIKGSKLDNGAYLDKLKAMPVAEQVAKVRADLDARNNIARRIKVADAPLSDTDAREAQVAALMAAWNKAGQEARQEFLARIDVPVMDRSAA